MSEKITDREYAIRHLRSILECMESGDQEKIRTAIHELRLLSAYCDAQMAGQITKRERDFS